MLAGKLFDLQLPQENKRLLTIGETDGCFIDGISVVTNCTVGHRTLRIEDYGKVAVTFVDTKTTRAFRVIPRQGIRALATQYAPAGVNKWETYLISYQRMPNDLLFTIQEVQLTFDLEYTISRAGRKAMCQSCGEEINNEREVRRDGKVLCRPCAGQRYYIVNNPVHSPTVA